MRRTLLAILFFVALIAIWAAIVRAQIWSPILLPSPSSVAEYLLSAFRDGTLLHVLLPASLPYLVSGMKQGWAFAWRSLMAAEIYVTILTGFGLGHLLHYGRELNAMDQVIGIMLVIVVIGLLADKILFSPWERFLHRRWGTGRV